MWGQQYFIDHKECFNCSIKYTLCNVYFIEQLKHSLWSIKYTWPEKCTLQHLKYTFPFDLAYAKLYKPIIILWYSIINSGILVRGSLTPQGYDLVITLLKFNCWCNTPINYDCIRVKWLLSRKAWGTLTAPVMCSVIIVPVGVTTVPFGVLLLKLNGV